MPAAGDNIEAVQKTIKLLEILSKHNGTLTVTQIADMLDCSISSANRFLQSLTHSGYVHKNPITNRYEMTFKLNKLTNQFNQHNRLLQSLIPLAHAVSQKYDISVNINSYNDKEAVLLFPVSRFYNKDLDFASGQHAPAYCTSSGKAILSTFSEEQLSAYFDGVNLTAYQGKTVTEADLRQELKVAQTMGYAICAEEYVSGIFSLSFPVKDKNGCVYAFTLIMNMRDRKKILQPEVLKEIRQRIKDLL